MFFIRTEELAPYKKFENKFVHMFNDVFATFNSFKRKTFNNFTDQAAILAEVGANLDNIREQIKDTQDQLEENDTRMFEDNFQFKKEFKQKLDEILKK